MRVTFDTLQFKLAHGRKPRGTGAWAFTFVVDGKIPRLSYSGVMMDETFITTDSYSEAKRAAARYARRTFASASDIEIVVGG